MRPIFAAILSLLLIAGVCVGGAAYLIDEATKQVEQESRG
jgi:hypothetical protein